MSIRAGVFGASGYTGAELLRYLAAHPELHVVWATADRNAGKPVTAVFPHLVGYAGLELSGSDPASAPQLDIAFLALPHGAAAETGRALLSAGIRVVDLSADWRLRDARDYATWYGHPHPHPAELSAWTYGLPERHRDAIAASRAVANPGCYPTAAILALAPGVDAGVIGGPVIVNATSGISGAGRKVDTMYLFSERSESYEAYGVGTHRHTPEIEQELGMRITFTPHLAPMARGMLATCYAPLQGSLDDLRRTYEKAYAHEAFVHVVEAQPATKQTAGTNQALICVSADVRSGLAIITSAIDNLGKGAAGQAIQNANLMLGLDETAGLGAWGLYP